MADEEKQKDIKKMDDVSKPGETPASATSRPVIVKHRSIAKDPMVAPANPSQLKSEAKSGTAEEAGEKKDKDEPVSRKAPTLKPSAGAIGESEKPTEQSGQDEDTQEEENKSAKAAKHSDTTNNQSLGTAAVDVLANEAVKNKKDNKQEREKQEAIAKHIAEKTYFAPIGQISKRRAKMRGLFLLLLLLVVGAYLAIDAELVLPEASLPFDLIK